MGSTLVPSDRAMTSSYKLPIVEGPNYVSICSGLAAILNTKFLPAAITHLRRITVSHPIVHCSVQYGSVIITSVGLWSLWKIAFFSRPEVGCWPLNIGGTIKPP